MKLLKHFTLLALSCVILSCGKSTSKQAANKEGFTAIEQVLKDQFGAEAYYTDISITYNASTGNIVGATVTEEPESLKMGQWNFIQDTWTQNQDITIEVPQGTKAADYMFQLGHKISLSQLGQLIEQSVKQLKDQKNVANPTLSTAKVYFPDNGDFSKAEYFVNLQPEHGGTTFRFRYNLNGDLIKMNY